ncbi:L-beta-lysine 5,6-aminomutase beta subunit [compost metagenome]
MGAQVPNETLVARAIEEKADAILVSQVVTQKNLHIMTLTNLIEILEAEGLRGKMVVAVGGPRITHDLATELGFDAGFSVGNYAEDVASFVVQELMRRRDAQ